MKRLTCLITLLFCLSACGARQWTRSDTALEIAGEGLTAMDWGQTRFIAHHDLSNPSDPVNTEYKGRGTVYKFYEAETNPIIGYTPSVGRVNTYFISVLLLHPVISYILPKPWRTYWQAGTIGLEGWQDWYNASKGIGIDFHF